MNEHGQAFQESNLAYELRRTGNRRSLRRPAGKRRGNRVALANVFRSALCDPTPTGTNPKVPLPISGQSGSGGKNGSGWLVGENGVLTCAHVKADATTIEVRRASAPNPDAWVACAIVWTHPTLDIALLKIAPTVGQVWQRTAEPPSRFASAGEAPMECTALGFPNADARRDGLRGVEQAFGRLLPRGAARSDLVPFDVDSSVPKDALLWEGMSGAAVRDAAGRRRRLCRKPPPGVVVSLACG